MLRTCQRLQIHNPDAFWQLPDAVIEEWLAYDAYLQAQIDALIGTLADKKPDSLLSPEAWTALALARLG